MTARDTSVATAPIALQALVQHMVNNQLPAPRSITLPSPGVPEMECYFLADDATRWLASPGLTVVEERVVPVRVDSIDVPRETVHLTVAILSPVGDVRVLLKWFRVAARVPFTVLLGGGAS